MRLKPAFVRRLTEVRAADRPSAGGKAAGLGELAADGIPVPPGYVVTAEAFGLTMAALDPAGAIRARIGGLPSDVAAIARAAAEARATVAATLLPLELAGQITAAHAELGGDAPVAVRSSATMEDSAQASFAGLQDTYLGVLGTEAVLDAVRRCWASLYNDESVAYRRRIGVPERDVAMAVVVQRMVSPRAAGVMFTRSPVTGDRSVVAIEGTWGLGSALVAGDVTPDGFTISKVTGEITARKVGAKLRLHCLEPNGRGVADRETPADLRSLVCLTDDEARALARLARRVEDHYAVPQDIEWALLGDIPGVTHGSGPAGQIMLLQSRPETAWAARGAAPVATPKRRAGDHVLGLFGKAP
jgi:pyruvate, water dikinase